VVGDCAARGCVSHGASFCGRSGGLARWLSAARPM